MSKFSRRDFLRLMALTLGSAAVERYLSACSPQPVATSAPVDSPAARLDPTATAFTGPTEVVPGPTAAAVSTLETTSPGIPDLVVVRNGEPETLVRRAVEALGGMGKFVPQGANVVVKPNICVAYHTFEYAATTNPWVVGAVVKLCFEAGAASVNVMDYPFGGAAQEAYRRSGIQEQVEAAGGEMVAMSGFKYVSTEIPLGVKLKRTEVFDDILKADVLIDVPIAKHHGSARLTLGMKNLMGVVSNRSALHGNLGQCIADLNTLLRPKLTIVDAVRILMDKGPSGGDLNDVKKLDTLIASPDIVAADSYATTLFGLRPEEIPYIKIGTAMGLGRSDLSNLKIEELSGA